MQQEEKYFNYTKAVPIGVPTDSGNKIVPPSTKVGVPKLEWAKPKQITMEKRWPNGGSNPSLSSYSTASPLQATPPAKSETRYGSLGNELKNLKSVKEPIVVIQRPQASNPKQVPNASISSSPPGAGQLPVGLRTTYNVVLMKSGALSRNIPCTRSFRPSSLGISCIVIFNIINSINNSCRVATEWLMA